MQIKDCPWELNNLNSRTVEVEINKNDKFDAQVFEKLDDYDYQVIKVPVNKIDFNFGLHRIGYSFIEGQLLISKKFSEFDQNNELIQILSGSANFELVDSDVVFSDIFNRITPEMFITDRISVDPHFGKVIGCKRYKNWMLSERERGTAEFLRISFLGKTVGFVMYRYDGKTVDNLLGGIFPGEKNQGLGILMVAAPFLCFHEFHKDFSIFRTRISTNNESVRKIYEQLGFKLKNEHYVYVKHRNQI